MVIKITKLTRCCLYGKVCLCFYVFFLLAKSRAVTVVALCRYEGAKDMNMFSWYSSSMVGFMRDIACKYTVTSSTQKPCHPHVPLTNKEPLRMIVKPINICTNVKKIRRGLYYSIKRPLQQKTWL